MSQLRDTVAGDTASDLLSSERKRIISNVKSDNEQESLSKEHTSIPGFDGWPINERDTDTSGAITEWFRILNYSVSFPESIVDSDYNYYPTWYKGYTKYYLPRKSDYGDIPYSKEIVMELEDLGKRLLSNRGMNYITHNGKDVASTDDCKTVSVKKYECGRISHLNNGLIIAANIAHRIMTFYQSRNDVQQNYKDNGFVCCPDPFLSLVRGRAGHECRDKIINDNKGKGIPRFESDYDKGEPNYRVNWNPIQPENDPLDDTKLNIHQKCFKLSINAINEYVTNCISYFPSSMKNLLIPAKPQVLHIDTEYHTSTKLAKGEINGAVVRIIQDRVIGGDRDGSITGGVSTLREKLPTYKELENSSIQHLQKVLAVHGQRNSRYNPYYKKITGNIISIQHEIYNYGRDFDESQTFTKKNDIINLGIDDSSCSSVTSLSPQPVHDMDFAGLAVIPESSNYVVYPIPYEKKKFTNGYMKQTHLTWEDVKLQYTPYLWTTTFNSILCHGSAPTFSPNSCFPRLHCYGGMSITHRTSKARQNRLDPILLEEKQFSKEWWHSKLVGGVIPSVYNALSESTTHDDTNRNNLSNEKKRKADTCMQLGL